MKRIPREKALEYEFNKDTLPVIRVQPGESFVVETEDASSGRLRSPDILPIPEHCPLLKANPVKTNPVAGPIYVEGVEKGDLLVINIEKIIPDKMGHTAIYPGVGPLADSLRWPELSKPYTHIMRYSSGPSGTTRDTMIHFTDRIQWPMTPMVGTIGVAPEREVVSTIMTHGPWGGNLDSRDVKEGTKVYINCYNDGGLLFIGDVHASQGDTEFSGIGHEMRSEVTASCQVIKRKQVPFVRLEKEDSIVSLFASRPLEDAVERATINLLEWMIEEYGMSPRTAYMLVSICPDFRINVYQMVRSMPGFDFTIGAELPKRYLVADT